MISKEVLRLLGSFPKKVSLRPKILERIDCGSYFREKVEYSVEKGERVKAYVLIPKNLDKKVPAIFCHHQNAFQWHLGKSEVVGLEGDSNIAYAKELVEKGFITFAPDAIAFEERQEDSDFARKFPFVANFSELANRLAKGEILLAKILHDASVGIDYLVSRKEVDISKIGFIGHSYGGKMALWVPAFDSRIKVSVSNCGCVLFKDYAKVGLPIEFTVPNLFNVAEIYDIVKSVEPCSLLISGTAGDPISSGAKTTYNKSKTLFKKGELSLKIYPGNDHRFDSKMRDYAYAFIQKHLV